MTSPAILAFSERVPFGGVDPVHRTLRIFT
jgi:hypothetical protein